MRSFAYISDESVFEEQVVCRRTSSETEFYGPGGF